MNSARRFGRFNSVGALTVMVKLTVLGILTEGLRTGYLIATAVSVEAAILHGFAWHHYWTWGDRRDGLGVRDLLRRLARYHVATGLLALAVNLAAMRILAGAVGLHYLLAGAAATAMAGLVNFAVSSSFIFTSRQREPS